MVRQDYIIPLLAGRLGNNMFMIAHAYAKALEYNKQLLVPRKQLVYEGYDYSENICRGFEFTDEIPTDVVVNPTYPSETRPTAYSGYFQSARHFDQYSENIKSLFGPPIDFIERIKKELPFIFEDEVTVINVRRGDYLHYPNYHPTVSAEYLNYAMGRAPGNIYLIASDDIEWCKANIKTDVHVCYLEGYKSYEQLWIMSMCHHFIISNSSFSWWAAYLSRNPSKVVLAPGTWFGPDHVGDWSEMYYPTWEVVPTKFENGLIMPL